jgi:hypothetical protein
MKIRREGDGIEKTHLGKVLSGIRLESSDFNGNRSNRWHSGKGYRKASENEKEVRVQLEDATV